MIFLLQKETCVYKIDFFFRTYELVKIIKTEILKLHILTQSGLCHGARCGY